MSYRTLSITESIYSYILNNTVREHPAQTALRNATLQYPSARMQVAPDQAQFLSMLVRMLSVKNAIEVGVFAGYSALAMALALPKDGRLLACDITDRFIGIGRDHWEAAGVAHKIHVRIAPALETLDEEIRKGAIGTYDLAFIDADKRSYESYFERCLTLVRIGGVIAIDNVLWGGRVAAETNDVRTVAIRSFNKKLLHDSRVDIVLVPIGDGLMLACKR